MLKLPSGRSECTYMYVVQILERGIENQLHGQSSCIIGQVLKHTWYFFTYVRTCTMVPGVHTLLLSTFYNIYVATWKYILYKHLNKRISSHSQRSHNISRKSSKCSAASFISVFVSSFNLRQRTTDNRCNRSPLGNCRIKCIM